MMHEPEKSDSAIVAVKPANKTAVAMAVAEWVEPRAGTKGNTEQSHTRRTQSRCSVSQRLNRVRNATRQGKKVTSAAAEMALALPTQGRSRMPELGTYGSVRGASSNGCPYRDC